MALAAAVFLVAGAQDLAAQVIEEEPKVTVAAERSAYGFGIDDVVFTFARTGPKDMAFSVGVSLVQASLFLPTDELDRVVAFAADASEAELRILARDFDGPATESGALRATLVDGPDYMVGRPQSAAIRMEVKDPAITVRPEQASYTVEEGEDSVRVTFVARTAADLPKPGKAFAMAVSSNANSDETAARDADSADFQTIDFKPGNFVAKGGEWEARKTVSFSMAEDGEGFEVKFKRAPSTPERIRPRNSDGTPCTGDVCMVPITMSQSEQPTLTITAEQDTYAFGIDDVVFEIARTGDTGSRISGSVTITQEHTFLNEGSLRNYFTIAAGETSATVEILGTFFLSVTTQWGPAI